jgi:hypothetical protein
MNIKLLTGISLSLFFFCTTVFAEPLQVGAVYMDRPDEVSFTITLPPGLETPPKPSDFQLLDGTKVIKSADMIERFSESNRKIVLLLCVDISGSITKALLKETQDALINIFAGDLPTDRYRFALLSFADKVVIPPDFTDNPDALSKSIRGLKISRGDKTLLYQAIIDSLNNLNKLKPAEYRRIVIITDGKDVGSIETADSVINLSKTLGIPIDIIGLGIIQRKYAYGLSGIADATEGRFIYPRYQSLSLKEAVNRLNNSFTENTWIVYFKYKPDAAKPKLENAVIKFKTNFSANISVGIPVPKDISNGGTTRIDDKENQIEAKKDDTEKQIDKEKLKKLLTYIGLPLLVLVTLVFIVWLFRRRKERIPTDTIIEHKKNPIDLGTEKIIQANNNKIPETKESHMRRTEAGSVIKAPLFNQDSPSILLVVTEGPLEGHKIPLNKQLFRIGANQDNDLVLVDDYVSGNHALLSYKNGELLLSDQQSRNGTRLNGELVKGKSSAVFPGDVIGIGNSSLKVTEF